MSTVGVTFPLTPVIVNVDVPADVLPVVVTVSVELPVPVTDGGEKLAVAPVGKPLTLNVTTPVNPFTAATLVVYVVELPTTTDCELGEAEMEKSGGPSKPYTEMLPALTPSLGNAAM